MAQMKPILEKKWEYTLFELDNEFVLSVMCGGSAMYELNIPVSSEDASAMLVNNDLADKKAERIRQNPAQYSILHVKVG